MIADRRGSGDEEHGLGKGPVSQSGGYGAVKLGHGEG